MPFNCTEQIIIGQLGREMVETDYFMLKKIEGIYLCVWNHTAVPQKGTLNDPTCLQRQ